ncbi:MAG: AAA family ATPase [Bdellovibrionota bacterium]
MMLRVYVVDASAEGRNKIIKILGDLLENNPQNEEYIPPVSIKPLAKQELKFNESPDICIVGQELLSEDLAELGKIKKIFPNASHLAFISEVHNNLADIEHLARMGADDVFTDDLDAYQLLKRIVLLSRKSSRDKSGKLILLDSGKGGMGVTSIAAGLGEALSYYGRRTLLIDFDLETQDLSRFMHARPYVNENLQSLLTKNRPVTQEFVEQCYTQIWEDHDLLFHLAPPPDTDIFYDPRSGGVRLLLSILEILDKSFDCIIVDIGSVRGTFKRTLYRLADSVVYLINNDPASLYASVDQLSRALGWMAPDAQLKVLENSPSPFGLGSKLLRKEFLRAVKLDESQVFETAIPHCKQARRWPGSGASLFSQGKDQVRRVLDDLLTELKLVETSKTLSSAETVAIALQNLRQKFKKQSVDSEKFPILENDKKKLSLLPASSKQKSSEIEPKDVFGLQVNGSFEHQQFQTENFLDELSSESLISGVKIN